jgi:glycosyltransferase involved in cell wall biosynthesis
VSYPVAAVILSHNNANKIDRALESVAWCNEVFIVDSQSNDGTRKIAREYGATIIDAPDVEPTEPFDHLRQLGIDAASYQLILRIDSDEWFRKELQTRLQELIENSNEIGIVSAPRVNYVGERRLTGGRQWPDYQPILFKSKHITIHECVHEWIKFDDDQKQVLPLQEELLIQHDYADSLKDYFETQRRYAKIAGNNRRFSIFELFVSPIWAAYHTVIELRGYRDGLLGLGLGLCWSWYHFEMRIQSFLNRSNF